MGNRIVIPEDQVTEKFLQACRILSKLRYYKRRFEENHDAGTRQTMKHWEKTADVFLDSLETEEDPDFLTAEKPLQ